MDKFDGYKQQLEKDLKDGSKPWTKYLQLAEEKTGVNRLYIFLGKWSNALPRSVFAKDKPKNLLLKSQQITNL